MEYQAVGKIVVVKFFNNLNKANSSKIITRTLKKIGFIDSKYQGPEPAYGELWKVKISNEINPGAAKGCFLLEPLERVEDPAAAIGKLLPGMYEEKEVNGTLFVTPKNKGHLWIMPLINKKIKKDIYAIIVQLN